MRTRLVVVVVAVASLIASCSKKEPEPAQTPAPEVKTASKPADPPPAVAPPPKDPAPVAATGCALVTIKVASDGITVRRDTETKTTQDQLRDTLRALGEKCIGPAAVIPSPDIAYQDIVAAIDIASQAGFIDVVIASSEADAKTPTPAGPAKPDPLAPTITGKWEGGTLTGTLTDNRKAALQKAPVIIARVGSLEVAGKTIKIDASDLGAQIKVALDAAPKTGPAGVAILQADVATKGSVILAIIDAAEQAGYDHVLFAVKNR